MPLIREFWRTRRSAAAVEFALVSTFLLLPLFLGGADFVVIISAQAQLNTALQAIDYFAYTNPGSASNTTYAGDIVTLINAASVYHITLPTTNITVAGLGSIPNGSISYGCFSGTATATTTPTYQTSTCPTGDTIQNFVSYKITSSVTLPVPLPGLGSPFTLNAMSTIETK
ncbi:MAG: TadE/TadG family type IV pilus assembly protein [Acidocella sp.]|nr:TadE/TadG family type IV pilus assembly protein [Acidocella sp.]